MTHQWDEFSKSLAENTLPRRQSLRLLGAALAGAFLSPLGLGTASAAGRDPCKSFCRCSNRTQQNQCLAACRACNSDPRRLCGTCGSYACCAAGKACCRGYCTDLASDFDNCGGCGNFCEAPGPYEYGACVDGHCFYTCAEGAVDCGDYCADLDNDFDNCGGCGAPCDDPAPYEEGACIEGACIYRCAPGALACDGMCTPVYSDPYNCGACGTVCTAPTPYCIQGVCGDCPPGSANCGGGCIDLMWDSLNCGACGIVCPEHSACAWGVCEGLTIN